MTEYAVGEVQELGEPEVLHAVADARPGTWRHSICSEGAKVWVHEVAGAVLPFPGLIAGRSCPECVHLVEKALAEAAPVKPLRSKQGWLRRPRPPLSPREKDGT